MFTEFIIIFFSLVVVRFNMEGRALEASRPQPSGLLG